MAAGASLPREGTPTNPPGPHSFKCIPRKVGVPFCTNTAVVAISKFTGQYGFDTPWGTIMAAGVVLTIPLIILVLVFQRRIVAGLTAGGVK